NVRGLADDELVRFEIGRRERRTPVTLIFEPPHKCSDAFAAAGRARDVFVLRARLLECETHELAAARDGRPIVELVAHDNSVRDYDRGETHIILQWNFFQSTFVLHRMHK